MKQLLFIASASLLLASCGEVYVKGKGNVVTEQKQVDGFSSIDIAAPVKAEITIQEGAPSVSLDGYENVLKHIRVSTKNNELVIEVMDGVDLQTDKPVTAIIHLPRLENIDLSGAVTANVRGVMHADAIGCDLSGSTKLSIESIAAKTLDVDISGLGLLDVGSGQVETASYNVSGSGTINSYGMQANHVLVDVSGSGTIQTTALTDLDVSISGAGNVSYKGNPAIKQDISGAGSLKAVN